MALEVGGLMIDGPDRIAFLSGDWDADAPSRAGPSRPPPASMVASPDSPAQESFA